MENICERHNLPHTINVFGYDIEINLVEGLGEEENVAFDWGQMKIDEPTSIRINTLAGSRRAYQTLVHEVIEYLNAEMELELEHPKITQLELGLTNFLLNNDIDWGYVNGSANQ